METHRLRAVIFEAAGRGSITTVEVNRRVEGRRHVALHSPRRVAPSLPYPINVTKEKSRGQGTDRRTGRPQAATAPYIPVNIPAIPLALIGLSSIITAPPAKALMLTGWCIEFRLPPIGKVSVLSVANDLITEEVVRH
ncbi:hypothetical protein EUGRSUZ_E00921 [Eucalyptus grandis]|uniref:Uncharacterized protein n=2 Tax=Eucalyptus grandis TaxID=71139 RepID=A0ACC3KVE1_EUCGR|nr:hypothetical protein EUGRSUZ_E00921 [Eucalyptus grandis]